MAMPAMPMRAVMQTTCHNAQVSGRPIFEICVDSVAGVRVARAAGADRVELCSDLAEGGITPSIGLIEAAVAAAGPVAVHVLIRPRGGDFVYGPDEAAVMLRDVDAAAAAGAAGIVSGALSAEGTIDAELTGRIKARCELPLTFHRAFDVTVDPVQGLETLIELGVPRLLTSGQQTSAAEGADLIAALHRRAAGRIVIMAGGGITERNVASLRAVTGVGELHFSGAAPTRRSGSRNNAKFSFGGGPDGTILAASPEKVAAIMAAALSAA
jgi:copper homeostasis protein